jgi:hypothetical protein
MTLQIPILAVKTKMADYSKVKHVHMQKQEVNMWDRWVKDKIENKCVKTEKLVVVK